MSDYANIYDALIQEDDSPEDVKRSCDLLIKHWTKMLEASGALVATYDMLFRAASARVVYDALTYGIYDENPVAELSGDAIGVAVHNLKDALTKGVEAVTEIKMLAERDIADR